jgi:hypothetical protein
MVWSSPSRISATIVSGTAAYAASTAGSFGAAGSETGRAEEPAIRSTYHALSRPLESR